MLFACHMVKGQVIFKDNKKTINFKKPTVNVKKSNDTANLKKSIDEVKKVSDVDKNSDSTKIIGKAIKVKNVFQDAKQKTKLDMLIAQYDFPDQMNWDDANAACSKLGKGWRLPSIYEWVDLYNKLDIYKIIDKNNTPTRYWTSTESKEVDLFGNNFAYYMSFFEEEPIEIKYRSVNSPNFSNTEMPGIKKRISVGNTTFKKSAEYFVRAVKTL